MEPKDWIALAVGLVGIGTFAFGIYQYRIAQKWKRSEFAAGLLERMAADWRLNLCMLFLDWKNRQIPVPEAYRSFFSDPTFEHNWEHLRRGLAGSAPFKWEEIIYRDLFSHFFDYLVRINHYIEIDLISTADIGEYLEYYLRQIAAPRYADEKEPSPFTTFIKTFDYEGVEKLLARFNLQLGN